MNSIQLLQNQLQGVHAALASTLDGVTESEWLSRVAPRDNRVGFLAWHVPAVRDWAVHTMIGGGEPLSWQAPWRGTGVALCPLAFGMPGAEADLIAEATRPAEVLAYSEAVSSAIHAWLGTIDESLLDTVPGNRSHLALSPRFSDAGYLKELDGRMWDYRTWQLLTGACFANSRGHLGELGLALSLIRAR